jgi:hypothetical protein
VIELLKVRFSEKVSGWKIYRSSMRELPVSRAKKTSAVPAGAAFRYTSNDRIEDRATLESDSSASPVAGMKRKPARASPPVKESKFILAQSDKLRGLGRSPKDEKPKL